MSLANNIQNLRNVISSLEGKAGGGNDRYDEGVEAGKQAEYDLFWDAYQQNGTRRNYYQLFVQSGWTDTTFKPKYPINCYAVQSYESTNATEIFNNCYMTRIPVPITVTGLAIDRMFQSCRNLETIDLLVLNGVTSFTHTFLSSPKIKNITIGGSIDVNFNIAATAVLTNESVQSIIDHLKDLTGATAQTLTLHADVGAKLTQTQKDTISAKNWNVTY